MWYKKIFFFIDMKFGINQAISQTITQLSCTQLETPSSRLWNFLWIKTYTTFKLTMIHYDDVIMGTIASQITSLTIVYSALYSGADQSKHQSSASLAFVRGIHRGPVNSPHKWPVTRKMSPFDDVIMQVNAWPCGKMWFELRWSMYYGAILDNELWFNSDKKIKSL